MAITKITKFDKIKTIIKQTKSENKTVGICHGVFDLVHPGHIKHFESASKLCDILVVSLTSDYYVKGPDYKHKNTKGILSEREAIKSVGGKMLYTDDEKYSTSKLIDKIKQINKDSLLLILDRDGTLIEERNFLGKNKNYLEKIEYKREVIDIIHYLLRFYALTNIVVTNQAGVARGYFTEDTVQKINSTINDELLKEGIEIASWKYALCVDKNYAEKKGIENFNSEYIKNETSRKPSPQLVHDFLKEQNEKLETFKKVLVLGDREDDEKLAQNLDCFFVNVSGKTYEETKKEVDSSLKLK
jgi:histidinol-phosphate phosphatase family protein